MDTLNETIEMLKHSAKSRKRISEDTGLGKDWLDKLAGGHIGDPGIKRITALHDYLAKSSQAA